VRDGGLLDTPDRRGDEYRYYSSFGSGRNHDSHDYHPYRRSDMGYFLDEFKKEKPPTFDGDVNNMEDPKAWIIGMKKLFELHEYIDNMKAMISIFIL